MRASWLMIDRTVGHRCAGSSNAAEVAILSAHDLASKAVLRGHRDLVFASQFVSNTHLVTGMLGRCALSVVNLNHRLNHPMQAPGTARFVCGMCRHWLRPIDQTLAPAQRRCRVFSLPPSLASSIVAKFVPCRSIATCRYAQQSAPPFVRNLPHQPNPNQHGCTLCFVGALHAIGRLYAQGLGCFEHGCGMRACSPPTFRTSPC
jgi:hypothetical protein